MDIVETRVKMAKVTQPAVSASVAELEKMLGAKLFDRRRGEAVLTEKGRLFEGYARQINHWYKAAEDAFHPSPLDLAPRPEAPARIALDEGTDALVWSSGGDLHIEIEHK